MPLQLACHGGPLLWAPTMYGFHDSTLIATLWHLAVSVLRRVDLACNWDHNSAIPLRTVECVQANSKDSGAKKTAGAYAGPFLGFWKGVPQHLLIPFAPKRID